VAIRSFGDKATERFFLTGRMSTGTGWASLRTVVRRKLDMLHYAVQLYDLRSPPGNRLQSLKGRLVGLHSIRVNDQWRIVFQWTEEGATDVRVTDYH
jgi:proteic killer suppression protein